MKKYYLLVALFFAAVNTFVQAQNVGIGPTSFSPDAHAMLHVSGDGLGLGILIPNMDEATRTGMTPDATDYGLLVYQTDGGSNAGYWYWDGTVWKKLFAGSSDAWQTTGNSGTTPGTHFIGTTDNQDWLIYTNNAQRIEVEKTGEVGINTAAVASTQLKVDNTTGNAIWATTSADGGYGIYGENSSTAMSTSQYGIYANKSGSDGSDFSATGYGLYATASGTANDNIGVYGTATGGFRNYGVYGTISTGLVTTSAGVYGSHTGTASGTAIRASRSGGTGATTNYALSAVNSCAATGSQYGVYGSKTGATVTGNGYAIYGTATGTAANNYAGYFTASGGTNNFGGVFSVSGAGSNNWAGSFAASGATVNYGAQFSTSGATGANDMGINVINSSTGAGGNQYGVRGVKSGANAIGGYAVSGQASGAATNNYGGYFTATAATNNTAVYGSSTAAATNNYGGLFSATGATNNYGLIVPSGGGNVGIGTSTPSAKSLLDITSTAAGVLVPRMTSAQKTAIAPGAGANYGLLVYQTDGTAGYYYWDGAAWVMIATGSGGWSLTGNAGTTPGTHFIGTTDNQDWLIYTNNAQRIEVEKTGEVGINTAAVANSQLKVAISGAVIGKGIVIDNSATGAGQTGLDCDVTGNTGGSGTCYGVNSTVSATAADNYAGRFNANGTATWNYGLYSTASNGSSTNCAIFGQAFAGGTSTGVSGQGLTYGVSGTASGDGGKGVYGSNTSTGTGSQYGMYGEKTGNTGTGTGYGIYGAATGTAATNYGGYFTASGGTANYGLVVPSGGGNVGIATITPAYTLDVGGVARATGDINFTVAAQNAAFIGQRGGEGGGISFFSSAGSYKWVIQNMVGVGIRILGEMRTTGAAVSAYSFTPTELRPCNGFTGNLGTNALTANDRWQSLFLNVAGGAWQPATAAWSTYCDERLKTNIKPFYDGLDIIKKINPVTYHYNGKGGLPTKTENVGIIAQDIQKVAPYTIIPIKLRENETDTTLTEYLGFNFSALNYVIINAIKELADKNEELTEKNYELAEKIKEIENLKTEYENRISKLEEILNAKEDKKMITTTQSIDSRVYKMKPR